MRADLTRERVEAAASAGQGGDLTGNAQTTGSPLPSDPDPGATVAVAAAPSAAALSPDCHSSDAVETSDSVVVLKLSTGAERPSGRRR